MLNVRCQAHIKIDAKGRVQLPAPLRRALEVNRMRDLVLAYHQGAVWGYMVDEWEQSVEEPAKLVSEFEQESLDFAHAFFATAQDVELDRQGRVRIPPMLRDLAGLGREIVIHSVLRRIEFWDKAAWDARFKEALNRVDERRARPVGEGA
jgi:MraZ protein